ncbi:MAG: protein phosphatase 2C domain-containing protein [Pyrinomonadaceae bacterium]|nr:protein phosphatase 2C domain-containing protein [Pyrinomonadaceae bacterium]
MTEATEEATATADVVVAANANVNADAKTVIAANTPEWRIIGETVPGASHLRAGVPNQDAILHLRESSVALPLILSISDGHGSNKCFRSDRGSRFAVTIGAELMRELLNEKRSDYDASKIENKAKEGLPVEFARRWNEAVAADLKREPLTKAEFDQLEAKDGGRARQIVEAHQSLAYGATTLTVALTQSFVLYLQLGDGEIITVSQTGEVSKPLPEDERLLANETTSLCSDSAAKDFRFAYQPLSNPPPALILMTTDGYANSFTNDAGFLQVGSDILEMLRTNGFDTVNRSVKGWIEEATRVGSGDDCTLGILVRMDSLKRPAPSPPAETSAESSAPLQPSPSSASPHDTQTASAKSEVQAPTIVPTTNVNEAITDSSTKKTQP